MQKMRFTKIFMHVLYWTFSRLLVNDAFHTSGLFYLQSQLCRKKHSIEMGRCLSQNIETCQNATKFASVVKLCQKYLCSDQMGFIEVSKLLFQPIYVLKSTHTHTRQAKLVFLFVKTSFCQMERSGVVWGDYVSRLQLYLIHLFKTSIIESRPYRWPGE